MYKIVKIIDEYNVVVNAGRNDGIDQSSLFEIYEPGSEILDPDTGKSLGALDFIKSTLEVVSLYPNMCLCTNNKTITTNAFSTLTQSPILWGQTKTVPLNINTEDISGGLEIQSKKIRVGDLVRLVD